MHKTKSMYQWLMVQEVGVEDQYQVSNLKKKISHLDTQ